MGFFKTLNLTIQYQKQNFLLTMTISVHYKEKWEVIIAPHYKVTECEKMVNSQRGKLLKEVYKNGMHGFCIEGKFYSKAKIRTMVRLIKGTYCPF